MGDDNQDEIKRITDSIIRVCENAFAEGREYVLLSRLGVELGQEVKKIKYMTGRGLAEFIRTSPKLNAYSIVTVAGTKNIFALVRTSNMQEAGVLPATVLAAQPSETRFHYRFWAAFSVPSTVGKRRFIDPESFVFKDTSEGEEAPTGWLPVEEEFIAAEKLDRRDQTIKDNIEKWLEKHGLDRSRFLQNVKPSEAPQRNLLFAIIEALDRRQLQATNLSLDVIATLAAKKI
ncbi:MAG TPA: hypothetical protein VIJ52_04115 [Pseudolabrys sp.]